jgi:hypothetical protein
VSTKYPPAAPSYSGDTLQIHRFLQDPAAVALRMRTILNRRYISDVLLKARLEVQGGAITWESGEPLTTAEAPRAVAPGAEYPLVKIASGTPQLAKTTKWGQDAEVTDEAIKRLKRNPVDRAFTKLANQNVATVDALSLSVIASAVTATHAAAAVWATATAEQILTDVMVAKAKVTTLGEGFDPDVVGLNDLLYAIAKAKFIAAGYLPREGAQNAIATGDFPRVEGMLWLPSPFAPATPIVADTAQLGGMADEEIGGPGYVSAGGDGTAPVEVKSIRDEDNDQYRLRARRVTVPVVLEPAAAIEITGTA